MAVMNIEDIDGKDQWVNLEATLLQLWDNEHPAIRQVGLLKDDTGIIKFVSWSISGNPLMEEGKTYQIRHMPVMEYKGMFSVGLVKTTTIKRIEQPEQPKQQKQSEIPTV